MEYEKIEALIKLMEDSSLTTFSYKDGESEILLKRDLSKMDLSDAKEVKKVSHVNDKDEELGEERIYIKSPVIGTFYEAPSPQAKPFVSIGDKITKGQVVGIVEAMKMMNEVVSEYDGVVEEILVENEQIIEYDQPLYRIKS